MAYDVKSGDQQSAKVYVEVSTEQLATVTLADLQDEDSVINDKNKGGKKQGVMYAYPPASGKIAIVVATGDAKDDPWAQVGVQDLTDLTPTTATDISADLASSGSGDVGDAAGIAAQLNLIEAAFNAQIDTLVTQLNLIEAAVNAMYDGGAITPS